MGAGASAASDRADARRASRFATQEGVDPEDLFPADALSWVVLGEAHSGRRTLARHLVMLYSPLEPAHLEQFVLRDSAPAIREAILLQLQTLVRLAEEAPELNGMYSYGDEPAVRHDLFALAEMQMDPRERPWTAAEIRLMARIWQSGATQGAYHDRGILNELDEVKDALARPIDDSLAYFLDPRRLATVGSAGYEPSWTDSLHFPAQSNLRGVREDQLTLGPKPPPVSMRPPDLSEVVDDEGHTQNYLDREAAAAAAVHIQLTTQINRPDSKWLSALSDGASSLVVFTVSLPALPAAVGGRISAPDQTRMQAARSLFASVANAPCMEFVPLALVMTKSDLCRWMPAGDVLALADTFLATVTRELPVTTALVDCRNAGRVKAMFRKLVKATLDTAGKVTTLRARKEKEARAEAARLARQRRKWGFSRSSSAKTGTVTLDKQQQKKTPQQKSNQEAAGAKDDGQDNVISGPPSSAVGAAPPARQQIGSSRSRNPAVVAFVDGFVADEESHAISISS